ncbi:helix-turn-helix domain-containing protein [Streptomyces sp. S07_1.15]|uniref:helix-turn-helix domain-containing protein n=1 Tax=Streptomyces sp. S07_1.15 TaxID=2873925 RepID=UPI001D14D179|nr:helix-turn-helix domain-containing protein [Streptomyces sp. S07_1.15]
MKKQHPTPGRTRAPLNWTVGRPTGKPPDRAPRPHPQRNASLSPGTSRSEPATSQGRASDLAAVPESASGTGSPARLLYTPEQAAELLQIPASWLRKKAAAGLIPCTRVGRHLRFSAADVETVIRDGARPARRPGARP